MTGMSLDASDKTYVSLPWHKGSSTEHNSCEQIVGDEGTLLLHETDSFLTPAKASCTALTLSMHVSVIQSAFFSLTVEEYHTATHNLFCR